MQLSIQMKNMNMYCTLSLIHGGEDQSREKVMSIIVVISCKPLGIISYLLGNSNAGCDYATGILHYDSHRG